MVSSPCCGVNTLDETPTCRLNCALYAPPPSDEFKMPRPWFAPAAGSDLWPRASRRSSGDIRHSHSCHIAWFHSTLSFGIQRMSRKENNLLVWNNLVWLYQGAPANVYLTGVFSGIVSCPNWGARSGISTCPLLAVVLNMTALLAHVLLINLDYNVKLVFRLSSSQHLYSETLSNTNDWKWMSHLKLSINGSEFIVSIVR